MQNLTFYFLLVIIMSYLILSNTHTTRILRRQQALTMVATKRAARNITETTFVTKKRSQWINDHYDKFNNDRYLQVKRTTVLQHFETMHESSSDHYQPFYSIPGVNDFFNSSENHEFILDLLAYHRIEQKIYVVDTGATRQKRTSLPAVITDDSSTTYTFKELELLEALTPSIKDKLP